MSLKSFINFFRKISRNSYYYYPRYYYYEQLINKYDTSTYLKFTKYDIDKIVKTNTEIGYSKDLPFYCQIRDAKKKLKTPNFIVQNKGTIDVEISFFRVKLGSYKAKMEMHFYEQSLFYFNYTFPYIADKDKTIIFEIIRNKYLSESLNFDPTLQTIVDQKNNCIQIEDHLGVGLILHYVALKHPLFKKARFNELEEKKRQNKINQAKYNDLYSRL